MLPRLPLLLALLVVLFAAPASADPVRVPAGGPRATTLKDLRPQRPHGGAYNEAWTYTLQLNDGMQARFSLSRANLGRLVGKVSGAEFAITGFNGQAYRAPKEYDDRDLRFDEGSKRLQVHPEIFFEGDPASGRQKLGFGTVKNDVRYDVSLTLSDIAGGLTWGDGVFKVGKDEMGVFIHIPYARVSGTVTIGGVTKEVSGTAYMDHVFQTNFGPKLARTAVRYVQHRGTPEAGYFAVPANGDGLVGFGVARAGGRYVLRKPRGMEVVSTRRVLGAEVPHQLAIRFETGDRTILNRGADQQAFSVLQDLGGLSRSFVSSYIGGEPIVLRGYGKTNADARFVYEYVVMK